MKLVFFVLVCCTLTVQQAGAQWKKIADFLDSKSESVQVNCIYFLDLNGPPRVGYTSASLLYKTTDGGQSWEKCLTGSFYFKDIFFVDSLLGWAVGYQPVRTTDGGKSWRLLDPPVKVLTQYCVYYSGYSKKLFMGLEYSVMLVSTDLGDTWQRTNIKSVVAFAFSSPKNGILVTNQILDDSHHPFRWIDSLSHVYVTSDGGDTWRLGNQPFSLEYAIWQPLAIPNTSIYFEMGLDTSHRSLAIYRSDDSGMNWRQVHVFPDTFTANTIIRGNLQSLYFQSVDSGMYRSTDEGVSWFRTGGPSWGNGDAPRFYSKNGITIAASYIDQSQKPDGLWANIDPLSDVEGYETDSSGCLKVLGLFPNPSHTSAQNVSILLSYCHAGQTVTVGVYDVSGNPVGSPVTLTSDGHTWDRVQIPAPSTPGTYYIRVSAEFLSTSLPYSVIN